MDMKLRIVSKAHHSDNNIGTQFYVIVCTLTNNLLLIRFNNVFEKHLRGDINLWKQIQRKCEREKNTKHFVYTICSKNYYVTKFELNSHVNDFRTIFDAWLNYNEQHGNVFQHSWHTYEMFESINRRPRISQQVTVATKYRWQYNLLDFLFNASDVDCKVRFPLS